MTECSVPMRPPTACPALLLVVLTLCVSLSPGCGDTSTPPADPATPTKKLAITATVGMVADVVRGVAGDRAVVTSLMQSGTDPHLYRPTRDDMQRLQSADVVFYNGLLLEGKMTDALIRTATAGRQVFAVAEAIDPAVLLEPAEFAGHYDPHVWMDPSLWALTIDIVRDRLTEMDPAGAEVYAANAEAYRAQLDALSAYADAVLATVPEDRRVLVTAHDAFNYFGRRFGYEVVGIQGLSTESEAGVRDIERLVTLLVEQKIPAVFIESTVSPKHVRALIDGAQQQGQDVVIGGELFSDAMGAPGSYEGTYIGMIDHNVTTIVRALGGEAPVGGMQGMLTVDHAGDTP